MVRNITMEKKCSIELYVSKKFLFPNNYMEEVKSSILANENDYDIYFILHGDAFKIIGINENGRLLHIIVVNLANNSKYFINIDVFVSFLVPYCSYLVISSLNEGSILKVEYNEKGIEYLKKYCPEEYKVYAECIDKEGNSAVIIHAKSLMGMQMENNGHEHVEQYDVLYIGQTKQDDIFNRLNNHGTLQRIMRESYRSSSQKDLYILILSIATKHIETSSIPFYNANFLLSNTLNKGFKLNN